MSTVVTKDSINLAVPEIKHNAEEIVEFLSWLRRDEAHSQVFALVDESMHAVTVTAAKLATSIEHYESNNLYWSAALPQAKLGKKPTKGELESSEFLHVDLDPISGLDHGQELTRLLDSVMDERPSAVPAPSAIYETGRGVQALWRLETPLALPEHTEAIEAANRWLIEVLHAPPGTHNVDRLLRLPGSCNHLDARKLAAGYKPARANLVEINDHVYGLSNFGVPDAARRASGSSSSNADLPEDLQLEIDDAALVAHSKEASEATMLRLISASERDQSSKGRALTSRGRRALFLLRHGKPDEREMPAYSRGYAQIGKRKTRKQEFADLGYTFKSERDQTASCIQYEISCVLARLGCPVADHIGILMSPCDGMAPTMADRNERYIKRQVVTGEKMAREELAEQELPIIPLPPKDDDDDGNDDEPPTSPASSSATPAPSNDVTPRHRLTADDIVRHPKTRIAFWTLHNVTAALDILGATVRRNLLTHRIEVNGLEHEGFGPAWDDSVENFVDIKCRDVWGFSISGGCGDYVRQLAHENRYHPIRDYLDGVKWDGVERLDRWLIDFGGAEDLPYVRAVSRLVLVALVKRIREPGAKFDEMLVLQSDQGKLKSSALKALMKDPAWFDDNLPVGSSAKETIEATAGRWLIEYADLAGLRRKDHDVLKSYLSRSADRARMSYDRHASDVPRQWVVVGTINSDEFLSDPTGNRRYWPVKLEKSFDVEALEAVRDQLWAEASAREAAGESIRLDKSLWEEASKAQKAHEVKDRMQDKLEILLDGQTGRIPAVELWEAAGIPIESRRGNASLKKAMENIGWVKTVAKLPGGNRSNIDAYASANDKGVITGVTWLTAVQDRNGTWSIKDRDGLTMRDVHSGPAQSTGAVN